VLCGTGTARLDVTLGCTLLGVAVVMIGLDNGPQVCVSCHDITVRMQLPSCQAQTLKFSLHGRLLVSAGAVQCAFH
jgi:hypothetical protein